MNWPFVSRARYELLEHNFSEARTSHRVDMAVMVSANEQLFAHLKDANERNATMFDAYAALRIATGANAPLPEPAPIVFPEPEQPPDVVLAAMQQISPSRDKTYEANWAHWEKNKERAKAHPDAFAEEIIAGAVDWTMQTI